MRTTQNDGISRVARSFRIWRMWQILFHPSSFQIPHFSELLATRCLVQLAASRFPANWVPFQWPRWSTPKQRERVTEPSLGGFGCLLCIQLHISWIRPYVGWKTPGRSEITGSLKLWVSCVLFKRSLPGILSRPNIHSVYRKQWGTRPMKWTARAKVRLICINDSKHLWPKPNAQVFTKVLAKLCW